MPPLKVVTAVLVVALVFFVGYWVGYEAHACSDRGVIESVFDGVKGVVREAKGGK